LKIDPPPILIDTREPDPHPWESCFDAPVIRGTLETGDFSLPGCGEMIAIERKTTADLISCLCSSRDRFTRELQRASRIPDFIVIVEGTYGEILKGEYRSGMNPKSAWESIIALQQRYRIPFLFAGSTEIAARLCESILIRWWKEHVKALEEIRIATKKAVRFPPGQVFSESNFPQSC
jgi:DNA excision repair protein ERCC-4